MVKAAFEEESLGLALSGGEDYELLFTARSEVIAKLKDIMLSPMTVIGEIVTDTPGQVTLLDKQGKPVKWNEKGWNHFKLARRGRR